MMSNKATGLSEGKGSKSNSSAKKCTNNKLPNIAKRLKKHAMKMAADPENK